MILEKRLKVMWVIVRQYPSKWQPHCVILITVDFSYTIRKPKRPMEIPLLLVCYAPKAEKS